MNNDSTVAAASKTKRSSSARRSEAGRIRRLRDPKLSISLKALDVLRAGELLDPPMTSHERVAWAVASTGPTRHWSVSSPPGTSYEDCAYRFHLLVPRIERNVKRTKGPLIYFGTIAKGHGEGGYHLHMLLWEEPYKRLYIKQCLAVGLGRTAVSPIDAAPEIALDRCSYVLGQHASVFGTKVDQRHLLKPKGKRRFLERQPKTLATYHPELFSALRLAKDKSVPDEVLMQTCPLFI